MSTGKRIKDGLQTFLDPRDLQGGELWKSRLLAEPKIADVVLFWSKHAEISPNVTEEWKFARELHGTRGAEKPTIVPILLDDHCPFEPHPLANLNWIFLKDG